MKKKTKLAERTLQTYLTHSTEIKFTFRQVKVYNE